MEIRWQSWRTEDICKKAYLAKQEKRKEMSEDQTVIREDNKVILSALKLVELQKFLFFL